MLMLPLETQVVDGAILELLEHLQGIWFVREQVESCLEVFNNLNASIVDQMIYPEGRDVKFTGDLRHG